MGIEGFRRLWALVNRGYPAPDDLSVAEVAENQCEAYKTLLLQVCVFVCERERMGERSFQDAAAAGACERKRRGGF